MSKTCSECGQTIVDRRAPAAEPANRVPRIVKPGIIFMKARGGQTVMVEEQYVNSRSTILATWSLEEYQAEVAAAKAKQEESADVRESSLAIAKRFLDEKKRKRDKEQAKGTL